jgi:hypothetical protein
LKKDGNGKDEDIEVKKVKITPSMAEDMLRKNRHNRPIVNSAFERMARDIKEGNWKLTGDTIKYDPEGNLIDGQHRLWACIEAGVPFTSMVAYNVEADCFDVIDSGMKRSLAHKLLLGGHKNGAKLAGACSLLWKYRYKYLQKNAPVRPTDKENMRILTDNPGLEEAVEISKSVQHIVSAATAAFLFFVFAELDAAEASYFFEKLATGEDLLQGDPIMAFRERLIKNRTSISKLRQRDIVILGIKAWNAYREKRKIRHIQIDRPGRGGASASFPEII